MSTVLVRAPKTASNRAQLLGRLDRLGKGAESLVETDDQLIALVHDYAGDEDAARAHFGADADLEFNALAGKAPRAGESEDWEPRVEIAGEVIERPASAREPQAPPEVQADPPTEVEDKHAPDTATEPSPGLSGAAQGQARRDKAAANPDAAKDEPAPKASKAAKK